MLTEAIEVYRSTHAADCEERAFVLTAVGVPHEISRESRYFVLWVSAWLFDQARDHIERHTAENRLRKPAPRISRPVVHPRAWIGALIFALVVLGVAAAIGNGIGPLNAFDLGDLDAARVKNGEWWRAWTALTLHLDLSHLILNLGAGVTIGYLAGRRLGYGVAWLFIVTGAAIANLLEGLAGPASHRAVGSSTAIFAALGLLAAYAWVERYHVPQSWAMRWGPLVAGVILLGLTGSEGENTDLVAHVAGFGVAVILGSVTALQPIARHVGRMPQWLAGSLALGSIMLAWACAVLA